MHVSFKIFLVFPNLKMARTGTVTMQQMRIWNLFSRKSSIVDFRLGSKYASAMSTISVGFELR